MIFFFLIISRWSIELQHFMHKLNEIGEVKINLLLNFTGSLVFYNAFLPEISTPDNFDKISARGYSFGYVGSVILLIICHNLGETCI